MQQRSDPLVPILGAAVSLVVVGAVLLVFVPKVSSWFAEDNGGVVVPVPDRAEAIPFWASTSVPGVGMVIEPLTLTGDGTDARLDSLLTGGPHRYYRLRIYNFEQDEPVRIDLGASGDAARDGFDSPEGGPRLLPATLARPAKITATTEAVLTGLGCVTEVEVPKGQIAQVLLIASKDVSARTAFSRGEWTFTRREMLRAELAAWHQEPTLKRLKDS